MTSETNQPTGDGEQSGSAPVQGGAKAKRRLKNFLLQPLLQIKLGLYTIILALIFSAAIGAILYINLGKFASIVVQLTDVEEEVTELLATYMSDTTLWLVLAIVAFLIANIIVSVIYTHKLVGPTIAFRRHIIQLLEGRKGARTFLRKGDAFGEVAEVLNQLSEKLEKQNELLAKLEQKE